MATSGDMQLQLILSLTDKVSGGLDKPIAKLRTLDTKVAETYKAISNLQRLMSQPVNTGGVDSYLNKIKGFDKLTGASRRVDNFNKKLNTIGDVKASPGLDNLLNKVDRLGGARGGYGDNYRGRHSERHSTLERLERGREVLNAPREIGDVWRRQAESLHGFADAALELDRAKNKFKAINLSESENSRAFSAVDALVQKQRGLTRTAGVEMVTDLHTVFGHLDEALASLDIAGKYRYSFESLFGDKFSSQEIEGQIQSGFKALEMLGATRATGQMNAEGKHQFTESDRTRMESYFNREAQITSMTGGRVTPAELLAMAKTGGTAVQGLSLEGLTNLVSSITEISGTRTGTALSTLFQNVVGGHMQQSGMSEWQRLGLMDMSKVEVNKSGIIQSMRPGAIPIGTLMQDDPLKFTDALSAAMKRKGIDTSNPQKVIEELGALKMPSKPAELVSLLINQRDRVVKESANVTNAKGIEGLNTQAEDSLTGKIKKYEAAMVDFKVNAGVPMIETAAKLAGWLTPIANFFAGHENVTLYATGLLVAGKAGVGLLETMITLRQAGILTQPISEAAKLEQAITGAGARTGGLGSKLAGLGGIVGGLTPLAVGLGLSAAIGLVIEMKTELNEIDKKNDELQQKIKGNYDSLIHPGGKLYTGKMEQGDADSIARQKITDLQKNGELQQAFSPWSKENWWTTVIHPSEYTHGSVASLFGTAFSDHPNDKSGYNPDAAANLIGKLAPEFGDIKVLTSALVQMRQGALGIDKNQESQVEKAIEKLDPGKYRVASKDAAEYLNQLDQKTQDTAKKLVDLSESASPLPAKLLNFGSALQTASAQASGFQMPTMPSFFGSNYPALKPDQPLSPRPQFSLPGAKPPSILNNFFHKTSALDADATRRPKTDSVAYLQPLREKTPATTLQRSSAVDADAVRRPAYSMAAFHPDAGKLSRVQTIAFTRPLDADAVRRPVFTKAVEKHSHVTREITNNLIKSETIAYFKPPRENRAVDSVPQSLRKVSDDAVRRPKADTVAHLKLVPQGMKTFKRNETIYTPKVDVGSALLPAIASLKEVAAPRPREKTSVDTFQRPRALDADAVRRPAYIRAAAIDVNSSRPSFAATQARVATRQGKQIGDVHIHIDGNAPAAKDPQLLAASIREELSKLSQQVGGVTKEMRDDRLLERRITFMIQKGRERA